MRLSFKKLYKKSFTVLQDRKKLETEYCYCCYKFSFITLSLFFKKTSLLEYHMIESITALLDLKYFILMFNMKERLIEQKMMPEYVCTLLFFTEEKEKYDDKKTGLKRRGDYMLEKHPLRHPVQCILSTRYVYIEKGFFLQLHFLVIKGTAKRKT